MNVSNFNNNYVKTVLNKIRNEKIRFLFMSTFDLSHINYNEKGVHTTF